MSQKDTRIKDEIHRLAAEFLQRESNYLSLITVTDISLSNKGTHVTIFFTVLPIEKEKAALDFIKRKRGEFRSYVMEKSRIGRVPFFDFEIDGGEKNRQRIDELSNEAEENQKMA
jgi:ribosome-binding factor A